ncbi:MAG: DUF2085 domain-containing protein [Anaerolineae bacterium]
MSVHTRPISETSTNPPSTKAFRRWLPALIVLGILLIMGFYSATNGTRLAHDPVLGVADWTGYAVCHRITGRSFTINGRQLPLCARCTGMYLGVTLVFLLLGLSGRLRCSDLPPLPILLVLLGFVALMGVDGINSYSHFFPNAPHLYQPRNWLRLLTGMGTGLAMGVFIFPALAQTLWRYPAPLPAIGSLREFAGVILVGGTAVLLVLSNQPLILYVLALASAAGVVMIVTALNAILMLMAVRRDGLATGWQQAAMPLLIGLILTAVEIAVISALRFNLTGMMAGFPGL